MNRIKFLREENGLTQQDLANKLGGAKSTVAMYEKGDRKPSLEVLIKLSEIFNCSIDYIIGKSNNRNGLDLGFYQKLYSEIQNTYSEDFSSLKLSPKDENIYNSIVSSLPLERIIDTTEESEIYDYIFSNYLKDRADIDDDIKNKIAKKVILFVEYASDSKEFSDILYKNMKSSNSAVVLVYGTIPAGIPMEMIEDIIDTEEIDAKMLKGGKEYFGLKIKGNSMYPEYLDGDIIILEKVDNCESGQDCVVMVNGNDGTFKRVFKNENGVILQPLNSEFQPMVYTNEQIEKLPVKVIGKVVELRRKK